VPTMNGERASPDDARARDGEQTSFTDFHPSLMQAPFPVAILRGPEHVIQLANAEILRAWHVTAEVVGLPLIEALPVLRGQPFLGYLANVLRTGESYEGREELARLPRVPGGEPEDSYFNFVYAALRDENGIIDSVLVSAFEVTEQVEARQQLEEALADARRERERAANLAAQLSTITERLHSAQKTGNIGVFDWDIPNDQLIWSPELYRLMGLRPGAIKATPDAWMAALVEADAPLASTIYQRTTAAREGSLEYEVRLKQPLGGFRWVRISAQVDYDSSGQPLRVLGAVVDIQALKEAAAVRELALDEVERSSRAKDEILVTMSHELRTPLNAMLGWATLLKSDLNQRGQLERGLTVIERSARVQSRLVDDLLDLSQIISGKVRLELRDSDAAALILAAVENARPAANEKRVQLNAELDPDLGRIVVDPERFQRLTWDLLNNAIKFTPGGGVVTVEADRVSESIVLSIEDTGPGIAAEDLASIFQHPTPADASGSRSHGGLDLGLSIARHLVEAHGGTVSANSAGLGKGATLTVSLPVRATAAVDAPDAEPAVRGSPASDRAQGEDGLLGYSVLLVDDDPDSLELHQVLLQNAGATVTPTSAARQALALVDSARFDALVSDIGMPEMDGYALVRALRAKHDASALPAIALTIYAGEGDVRQAFEAGFQAHLSKPVEGRDLVRRVLEVAGKRA